MTFSFHPEAEAEFAEGVSYYEDCQAGLGLDFAREVNLAIRGAAGHPFLWRELQPDVRRCLVHRFPYGVLYAVQPDSILVLAIMHLHRDPDYWKERL